MKDGAVADDISGKNRGNDEISILYDQTASMILEINEYMSNLKNTTIALTAAREEATHDALTGIRNKNAYDAEILSIWNIPFIPGEIALMLRIENLQNPNYSS